LLGLSKGPTGARACRSHVLVERALLLQQREKQSHAALGREDAHVLGNLEGLVVAERAVGRAVLEAQFAVLLSALANGERRKQITLRRTRGVLAYA
jgi:hypothetical protein